MGIEQVIATGTGSPVLVTDEQWRIVSLNEAAEKLLGRRTQEVRGSFCHAVFYGKDRFGNRFCHEQCTVGTMARHGEPIRPFELEVRAADDRSVRVVSSVVVVPGEVPSAQRIVHILMPRLESQDSNISLPDAIRPSGPNGGSGVHREPRDYSLTSREAEVLSHLAQGKSCQAIADHLFISLPTVRNHVHNFLRKLEVHSQVEAVSLAYREGLL